MSFENEGTFELVIQGLTSHEVRDFDGEFIGIFSDFATALGAQEDFNIIKMVIKKGIAGANTLTSFSCTFFNNKGDKFEAFLIKSAGIWYGPNEDPQTLMEDANAEQSSGPNV